MSSEVEMEPVAGDPDAEPLQLRLYVRGIPEYVDNRQLQQKVMSVGIKCLRARITRAHTVECTRLFKISRSQNRRFEPCTCPSRRQGYVLIEINSIGDDAWKALNGAPWDNSTLLVQIAKRRDGQQQHGPDGRAPKRRRRKPE